MDVVMTVLGLGGGLVFVARGLWVGLRGGPLVVKSTGRVWSSAGRAAAFWLLIGIALLVGGLLRIGTWVGVIGSVVGLVLGFVPLALCFLAVIAFPPRKVG